MFLWSLLTKKYELHDNYIFHTMRFSLCDDRIRYHRYLSFFHEYLYESVIVKIMFDIDDHIDGGYGEKIYKIKPIQALIDILIDR